MILMVHLPLPDDYRRLDPVLKVKELCVLLTSLWLRGIAQDRSSHLL